MLVAALLFAAVASAIPDADRVEPCPAHDGVLLFRATGITLLRLDRVEDEVPVTPAIDCTVAAETGPAVAVPLPHCDREALEENDGFAIANVNYDVPEKGLWVVAADGDRERVITKPSFRTLLGHGRVVVIPHCPVLDCEPQAFTFDLPLRATRSLYDFVPDVAAPCVSRAAQIIAVGFGSTRSKRAALVTVLKAGPCGDDMFPRDCIRHQAFVVVPSTGVPWTISDRRLAIREWDTQLLLHDSGTILLVTGRRIERISSPSQ
jgi:hypothetical protein